MLCFGVSPLVGSDCLDWMEEEEKGNADVLGDIHRCHMVALEGLLLLLSGSTTTEQEFLLTQESHCSIRISRKPCFGSLKSKTKPVHFVFGILLQVDQLSYPWPCPLSVIAYSMGKKKITI